MLATVIWIGGLAALSLYVLPAARKTLPASGLAELLGAIRKRLDPLSWFSLILLAGTGMIQLGASPNYQGFLAIQDRWAAAILVKHILFLGMGGISAYMTWGLLPGLQRLALQRARRAGDAEAEAQDRVNSNPVDIQQQKLLRQEDLLLRLNLLLGILILGLTAVARTG